MNDFIEANQKFLEVLAGAKLIQGTVPIKFETSRIKGYCTEYSLFIDFRSIDGEVFGTKIVPDFNMEYLIYGLDSCHGFLLLPENHNNFIMMVEDRLYDSIENITYGKMDYV
jgi:hypothetical protein